MVTQLRGRGRPTATSRTCRGNLQDSQQKGFGSADAASANATGEAEQLQPRGP